MNFARGKQMIVFDTGLNALTGSLQRSVQVTLPLAHRRWIVHPQNSLHYILNGVAQTAHATGGLNAVHFMGHGSPGSIRLGLETLSASHSDLFRMLRGQVGTIVFFSCLVGGQHRGSGWHRGHPVTFGQQIARASGATVVLAQQIQYYRVTATSEVDFGDWEGPVDVYRRGTISTYQADNPFQRTARPIDLEAIIFGVE
jgi:hypothetical protein